MKVFYHHAPGGNVGDDMNAGLWHRLVPDLDELTTAQWLVGAGTILDERINSLDGRKVVMGSGFRPAAGAMRLNADVRFAAVRGKLTAQQLGLGRDIPLGDPGFLVGRLRRAPAPASQRIGLIPHIYSERWSNISAVAADGGFDVISPSLPLDEFLQRLGSCTRVYTESLHGAIFADALRIAWARVRICSHYYEGEGVAEFKWQDAFSALDMPVPLATRASLLPFRRSSSLLRRALNPVFAIAERRLITALKQRRDDSGVFRLSDAARLEERVETLLSCVDQLRSVDSVERWRAAPGHEIQPPGPRTDVVHQQRQSGRALRVLAFPKEGDNAFLRAFSATLEARGAVVDDFSFRRALLGRYDVLHLHWPDSHLLSKSWWRALGKHARLASVGALLRLRGTRIIWMLHNIKSHEKGHWLSTRLFGLWFPRICTGVIGLTAQGLNSARQLYPTLRDKPSAIVPHGHYRDAYPAAPSRQASRERLGLQDRFTFLFIGNIRPYKNVPMLIKAFRQIPDQDVQLVIAGLPSLGVRAEDLAQLAAGDDRIRMDLSFIPEEKLPLFLGAANVVVLPFDSILNSGSVLLALSFDRTVLAPRLGALPEIHSKVGSRWLRLYDGPLTPQLLEDTRSMLFACPEQEQADLSAFDWKLVGARTLEFYRRCVGDGQSQAEPAGHSEAPESLRRET